MKSALIAAMWMASFLLVTWIAIKVMPYLITSIYAAIVYGAPLIVFCFFAYTIFSIIKKIFSSHD